MLMTSCLTGSLFLLPEFHLYSGFRLHSDPHFHSDFDCSDLLMDLVSESVSVLVSDLLLDFVSTVISDFNSFL